MAITTRPACKLTVGKGGLAGDRRPERNKVPGGLDRPGDGEQGFHAAGLCRIGTTVRGLGCVECVARSLIKILNRRMKPVATELMA